jgi:phosphoglycerol transferase MdoB-like AlkP superfamily enzyme
MIQRIQSVWLFLAAMINGLLFISKLYHFQPVVAGGSIVHEGVRDQGNLALFIIAAIITVLPLVTIFFFGDRKRQKGLVWLSLLGCVGFIGLAVLRVTDLSNQTPPLKVQYDFGLLMPVLSIIFLILALRGIRKDEKLIKSLDRLR